MCELLVRQGELRAAVRADWSRIDQRTPRDYVHWSDRSGLWFLLTAASCLIMSSVISGAEGAVFSKSVETPHVRAEPFKELRWVSICFNPGTHQTHTQSINTSLIVWKGPAPTLHKYCGNSMKQLHSHNKYKHTQASTEYNTHVISHQHWYVYICVCDQKRAETISP